MQDGIRLKKDWCAGRNPSIGLVIICWYVVDTSFMVEIGGVVVCCFFVFSRGQFLEERFLKERHDCFFVFEYF